MAESSSNFFLYSLENHEMAVFWCQDDQISKAFHRDCVQNFPFFTSSTFFPPSNNNNVSFQKIKPRFLANVCVFVRVVENKLNSISWLISLHRSLCMHKYLKYFFFRVQSQHKKSLIKRSSREKCSRKYVEKLIYLMPLSCLTNSQRRIFIFFYFPCIWIGICMAKA